MKCSAEIGPRKWPYGGNWPAVLAMVTAAVVLVLVPAEPAWARRSAPSIWRELFGAPPKPHRHAHAAPARSASERIAHVPLPQPRPAEAPRQIANVPLPQPRPAEAPGRSQQVPAQAKTTPPVSEKPSGEARTQAPAAGGTPAPETAQGPPPPSACRQALTEDIAIAPSIPDIYGPGGCGGEDLVRLEAVVLPDKRRVAVNPPATLRCKMATAIADWIRTDMVSLTAGLGTEPSRLENYDSYECRTFNGIPGAHLSEHGHANALDVRAIRLANGQSIVLTDRNVPRELREGILHSVCRRFMTVLGPGSDGYHEEHIHLDLMERHNNYKICQWNVLDPLPKVAPLLPAERPKEAPPREEKRANRE